MVPSSQALLIVEALRAKGLLFAYVTFANERHGFRRSENVKRALEAALYFYSRILRFHLADPVEAIPIGNLGGWHANLRRPGSCATMCTGVSS